MPFRSLATLQGGTAADVADTPGEPAGTRFVGFGENLTSAISNRPHYALAENTDDLNTRLASWETGGLDSAYDLGAAAVPGGGRSIVLDSGAIETYTNAADSLDSDVANAHFRAFMDDDEPVGVGLDAKVGAFGAFAGALLRYPLILGTTKTPNTFGACTLNPSGAGASILALNAGSFNNSGESSLLFGFDLIEITSSATSNGLYLLWDIGAADDRVLLRHLDGAVPSFPADEAGSCQVWRPDSYHGGPSVGGVGKPRTTKLFGFPGQDSVVALYPGIYSYGDTLLTGDDDGAYAALRTYIRDETSHDHIEALEIDWAGVLRKKVFRGELDAADAGVGDFDGLFAGAFTCRDMIYDSGGFEVSHVVGKFSGTIASEPVRYDFMSLVPSNLMPFTGEDLEYFADSPTLGVVNLPSAVAGYANTVDAMAGLIIEILTGAGKGFYRLVNRDDSAPDQLVLRNLDATFPSHFPTSGVSTFRVHHYSGIGGPGMPIAVDTIEAAQNGSWALQGSAGGEFTALDSLGATALALYSGQDNALGTGAFLRGYNGFGVDGVQEVVRLDKDGNLRTRGLVYYENRTTLCLLDSLEWEPGVQVPDTYKWLLGVDGWQTDQDDQFAFLPLSRKIPAGAEITRVEVLLSEPTITTAGLLQLVSRAPNFSTPAAPPTTVEMSGTTSGATGWQRLSITGSYTVSNTESINLQFDTNLIDSGSYVLGPVRVTYTDPGPRNN